MAFLPFPIPVTLEYTDADGIQTKRRVDVLATSHEVRKKYLYTYCHARRANRSFRLDRIQAVIDEWGEVHDAYQFFHQLDASVEAAPDTSSKPSPRIARAINAARPRRRWFTVLFWIAMLPGLALSASFAFADQDYAFAALAFGVLCGPIIAIRLIARRISRGRRRRTNTPDIWD